MSYEDLALIEKESGVHLDAIEAYESAQRVKELAEILIPIHDVEIGRNGRIPA